MVTAWQHLIFIVVFILRSYFFIRFFFTPVLCKCQTSFLWWFSALLGLVEIRSHFFKVSQNIFISTNFCILLLIVFVYIFLISVFWRMQWMRCTVKYKKRSLKASTIFINCFVAYLRFCCLLLVHIKVYILQSIWLFRAVFILPGQITVSQISV